MEKKKHAKDIRGDIVGKIVVGMVSAVAMLLLVFFLIALATR